MWNLVAFCMDDQVPLAAGQKMVSHKAIILEVGDKNRTEKDVVEHVYDSVIT